MSAQTVVGRPAAQMEFGSFSSRRCCACPRTARSRGQRNRFRCSATRPVGTNAMCPLVVSSRSVQHAIVSLAPGCCCFLFPSAEQQRRTRCSSYSNNRIVVSVIKKNEHHHSHLHSDSHLHRHSYLHPHPYPHPHAHLHSVQDSRTLVPALKFQPEVRARTEQTIMSFETALQQPHQSLPLHVCEDVLWFELCNLDDTEW